MNATPTGGGLVHYAFEATPLGTLAVAATARGVCRVALADDRETALAELRSRYADLTEGAPGDFSDWVGRVAGLARDPVVQADVPLDLAATGATAFRLRVWRLLRAIPAGQTLGYAAVAARLGLVGGSRAVAGACAANPVALVIPCHRVVCGDGSISGYRWGRWRKAELLRLEAALTRATPRL